MATTVIHVRDMQPGDEYIGRTMNLRGLQGSVFANPYKIGRDGTREEVIEKYRKRLMNMPGLLRIVKGFRGKRLACWCAPEPCHGDVLAELSEAAAPPSEARSDE